MNLAQSSTNEPIVPTQNDVVSGRGSGANRHKGNANFRELVRRNKQLYLRMSKKDKMKVAVSIYDHIASLSPPGRFLNKNPETDLWFETSRQRALEKISQALREKTASDRNKAAAVRKAEMMLPKIPPTLSMNPSSRNMYEFDKNREMEFLAMRKSRSTNMHPFHERGSLSNSPGAMSFNKSSSYSQSDSSNIVPLRMPETYEMRNKVSQYRRDFFPPKDDTRMEYPLPVPQPSWHKNLNGNSMTSSPSHQHLVSPHGLKRKKFSSTISAVYIPQPPGFSLHGDGTHGISRQDRMFSSPKSIINSPSQQSVGTYQGLAFEVEEDPPLEKRRRLPISPAIRRRNSKRMSSQQHTGVAEISLSGSSSSSSEDCETTASHDSSTVSGSIPEYVVGSKENTSEHIIVNKDTTSTFCLEDKSIPRQVQLTGTGGLEALSVAASLMSRS